MRIREPSPRQRLAEERHMQKMIEEARQESEVLQAIERKRNEQRILSKHIFLVWFTLDKCLQRLEEQRDKNVPRTVDEDWNQDFCNAICKIPEVRSLCKELWNAWCNFNRDEFSEWI